MQKVTRFLEKNVEWMVLGLAGLWVLYVVWFYVINPPVFAEIEGQQYAPAQVDEVILATTERDVAPKLPPGPVPPMDVPDFFENFQKEVGPRDIAPLAIGPTNIGSSPQVSMLAMDASLKPATERISELAKVPPPQIRQPIQGRGQVVFKVDENKPDQPLPPNAAPAGVRLVDARADRDYITVPAVFDEKQLMANYTAVNIPLPLQRREYLSVELEREEVVGWEGDNYVWGNKVKVPPLLMFRPPVQKDQNLREYMDWAMRPDNQPLILQPPFYQLVQGAWQPPVVPDEEQQRQAALEAQQNQAAIGINVNDPKQAYGHLKSLPPAEQAKFRLSLPPNVRRELTLIEQEEEAKQRQQRRPQQQQQPDRRRSSLNYVPMNKRTAMALQQDFNPSAAENSGVRRVQPGQTYNPWNAPSSGGSSYTNQPGMLNAAAFQGNAAGAEQAKAITIWAHDENPEPGKIYRYRLRVTVRNPVYNTVNIVDPAKPELAQVAELPTKDQPEEGWSAWSTPVRIPTRIDFFVQGTTPGSSPQVKFNIYRWQHGKYNFITTANLQPGDMVGQPVPDANQPVDYTTGWSVVDVRPAGNDVRVMLMDSRGQLEQRFMKVDQAHPRQKDLSFEMQRAAQAAADPRR